MLDILTTIPFWHENAFARGAGESMLVREWTCTKNSLDYFGAVFTLTSAFIYKASYKQLEGHSVGGAHVPPTKLFPRLTHTDDLLAVNKTILKPRVAKATGTQYLYVGFSRRNKIPRCST